jgi:hypothetical protein
MYRGTQAASLWIGLRQILLHGLITILAVLVAFSLPQVANYILNAWWPKVENDANLLLATEIGLASVLALLFNFAKVIWDSRQKVATARLASLVHARDGGAGWLSRWRERVLIRQLPAARDAFVLTLTGYDTFVAEEGPLRPVIEKGYEIRVMLINPVGDELRRRADSLPAEITVHTLHKEIEATIGHLSELRKLGKIVKLKFYGEEPLWKVIVLGDHVWVQHFHSGFEVRQQPEYVFALQHREPRRGLFVPFYVYFLNQWNDPRFPEYDFDTGELVYRDGSGKETGRARLGVPIDGAAAAPASRLHAASMTVPMQAALLRRSASERAPVA